VSTAIYDVRISHARSVPRRNAFTYRSHQWLVDLDALPVLPWLLRPLARFRAADHLGDPARTLRENLDAYLAGEGVDVRCGRILMLANARVLGHVFNPLSVYWCHRPDGAVECVVAEVHNTYGERHCYLLRPGPSGRAVTAKAFYVSPFNPVDGEYRMSLPLPGEGLALTIALHRGAGPPFVARVRGRRRAFSTSAVLRTAARSPLPTVLVAAQIRWQGSRLFLRRLPVMPRPAHRAQENVQ
jgi:DUF1365 family protein